MNRTATERHLVRAIDQADAIGAQDAGVWVSAAEAMTARKVSRNLAILRLDVRDGQVSPSVALVRAARIVERSGLAGDLADMVITALEHGVPGAAQ